MVRSFLIGFFRGLNHLLQTPQKVIWICLGLVLLNLIMDGSLFRLVSLYQDQQEIAAKTADLEKQTVVLQSMVKKARDPAFLEKQARDRFDLVSEGDLVFVFSEDEAPN
ncbi:MAG: septum formation initiator family protein [Bdellovibrionales bacterium]